MIRCCGPKCGSASLKNIPGLTFHKFPKDEQLCNAWVKNMKIVDWKPFDGAVLCSRHFEKCMFDRSSGPIRLKPAAIPTIFPELQVQVPYITVANNKRMRTTNNNTEKVLVLKPIDCDTSDDSSNDKIDSNIIRCNDSNLPNDKIELSKARNVSSNTRANSSNVRDNSSIIRHVALSNIKNGSSNVRVNSNNTKDDSSNESNVDSDSDIDTYYLEPEIDTYFEPKIEIVTLQNSMENRSVKNIGTQTKESKLNPIKLRKRVKALEKQVKRRDETIKKLKTMVRKMKLESYQKNTINLICVDDVDAYR